VGVLDPIPAILNAALANVFRNATLKVPTTPSADGQGGATPGTPTSRACKALVDDYSDARRQALGIPANDRRIIILAASVASGAIPAVGCTVTAEGRDWQVISVARDPAFATYELQVR